MLDPTSEDAFRDHRFANVNSNSVGGAIEDFARDGTERGDVDGGIRRCRDRYDSRPQSELAYLNRGY